MLVLAAGFSSRLGRPKALARIRGVSLLSRTVDVLAACVPSSALPGRIIVVVPPRSYRYRFELRGRGISFVANSRRVSGLSSSVRLGIRQVRFGPAVLIVPVDLARLQIKDIKQLIAKWRAARRRLVATRTLHYGGTPLILPRRFYSQGMHIHGDTGLRNFVRTLPCADLALVDLPHAALDVDTPQDLLQARRRHSICQRPVRQIRL